MNDYEVYILARDEGGKLIAPVKVGISNNAAARLSTIQTSCPFRLAIAHTFSAPNKEIVRAIEVGFHTVMENHRINGEWFDLAPTHAIFYMCLNYRAALEVKCKSLTAEERNCALEIAGVVAAEESLRSAA